LGFKRVVELPVPAQLARCVILFVPVDEHHSVVWPAPCHHLAQETALGEGLDDVRSKVHRLGRPASRLEILSAFLIGAPFAWHGLGNLKGNVRL
jgi:hypothetical protein